jgi:hypothetical protein
MATTIATNPFVHRQTAESQFSHFTGSWEELERLTLESFPGARAGYRNGVLLVPVPAEGFFASVVAPDPSTQLKASYEARRAGEEPFLQVVAVDRPKQPARYVDVVLYHHDVLAEDGDASSDAEWEIVSVNARLTEKEEPMDPVTMARNFLCMAGGTKGEFSAQQFAESIVYWANHCHRA